MPISYWSWNKKKNTFWVLKTCKYIFTRTYLLQGVSLVSAALHLMYETEIDNRATFCPAKVCNPHANETILCSYVLGLKRCVFEQSARTVQRAARQQRNRQHRLHTARKWPGDNSRPGNCPVFYWNGQLLLSITSWQKSAHMCSGKAVVSILSLFQSLHISDRVIVSKFSLVSPLRTIKRLCKSASQVSYPHSGKKKDKTCWRVLWATSVVVLYLFCWWRWGTSGDVHLP